MTYIEIQECVTVAKSYRDTFTKNRYIDSHTLNILSGKLKDMLKKEILSIPIGSVSTDVYTDKILYILSNFIDKNQHAVISIKRAGELINGYGKLLASQEYITYKEIIFTELEAKWVNENNFLPYMEMDNIHKGINKSLEFILTNYPSTINGFTKDDLLTDTTKANVTRYGGVLSSYSIAALIHDNHIIDRSILDSFNKTVYGSVKDGLVTVRPVLLDAMELGVNLSTLSILDLITVIKEKIKETSEEN